MLKRSAFVCVHNLCCETKMTETLVWTKKRLWKLPSWMLRFPGNIYHTHM